jgi:hypothetical protein
MVCSWGDSQIWTLEIGLRHRLAFILFLGG